MNECTARHGVLVPMVGMLLMRVMALEGTIMGYGMRNGDVARVNVAWGIALYVVMKLLLSVNGSCGVKHMM